jgi:L-threonylcarbamoyladenylate synthase
MPAHPVALELIRRTGFPIAAPSANQFGHISPTTSAHVLHDLDGRIEAVLDAGPTVHGVESTVLDPCQSPMVIYRPGAVTAEQIRAVAGPVEVFREGPELCATPVESLPSPGVGLRHYAPRARLILVEASTEEMTGRLQQASLEFKQDRVGIMLPADFRAKGFSGNCHIHPWGAWAKPEEMAHELYSGLRALDALGCTVILCPLPPKEGIGAALRDRLRKAATNAQEL